VTSLSEKNRPRILIHFIDTCKSDLSLMYITQTEFSEMIVISNSLLAGTFSEAALHLGGRIFL
jgi:hypothetical protein